jgi:hypothetical protein
MSGMAVVAAAVLALGACGNPAAHISSQRAVQNAVGSVTAQSGVHLQISLGVTPGNLMTMDKKLTKATADALASSSIILDFNTGNGEAVNSSKAHTDKANQFDFAVQVGSAAAPVEIRYVKQTLYARADVAGLLTDFGQTNSKAATSFSSIFLGLDKYVPGISALGNGNWVSVQTSQLAPLLNGVKALVPTTTAGSSQGLMQKLQAAFAANANYGTGVSDHGRTKYVVSVQARSFVQAVMTALPSSISSIPGASTGTKAIGGVVNQIPQTVLVDVWVSKNKVQEIDIDLNHFAQHPYGFAVPVRIMIGAGAPVTAPSGATALDLSKIPMLLGGLMGGSHSSSSGATAGTAPAG